MLSVRHPLGRGRVAGSRPPPRRVRVARSPLTKATTACRASRPAVGDRFAGAVPRAGERQPGTDRQGGGTRPARDRDPFLPDDQRHDERQCPPVAVGARAELEDMGEHGDLDSLRDRPAASRHHEVGVLGDTGGNGDRPPQVGAGHAVQTESLGPRRLVLTDGEVLAQERHRHRPGIVSWAARRGARVAAPLVARGRRPALGLGTAWRRRLVTFVSDGCPRGQVDAGRQEPSESADRDERPQDDPGHRPEQPRPTRVGRRCQRGRPAQLGERLGGRGWSTGGAPQLGECHACRGRGVEGVPRLRERHGGRGRSAGRAPQLRERDRRRSCIPGRVARFGERRGAWGRSAGPVPHWSDRNGSTSRRVPGWIRSGSAPTRRRLAPYTCCQ